LTFIAFLLKIDVLIDSNQSSFMFAIVLSKVFYSDVKEDPVSWM